MPLPSPIKRVPEPLRFGFCHKHNTWLTKQQAVAKCLKKFNDKCKWFKKE